MTIKLKYILFAIVFLAIAVAASKSEYDIIEDFVNNPYRVLKIPPWTSMKEVKRKYNELVRKHHPDKSRNHDSSEKFMEIQQAYQRIKTKRSIEQEEENDDFDEESDPFVNSIFDTLKYILTMAILFSVFYFFYWISFTIWAYICRPLFYILTAFIICDRMLPHYFYKYDHQIYFSLLFGLVLWKVRPGFILRLFRKQEDQVENKKNR
jgi:hypothetical protein